MRFCPSLWMILLGLLSGVFTPIPLAIATPTKPPKQKHLTVQRITHPPMLAPAHPKVFPLQSKGHVQINVKLIYAHKRQQKHIDRSLRRDLPKLSHITGFNSYQLMRHIQRVTRYKQAISIHISKRFQVRLNPKGYNRASRSIALQAIFLYRVHKGKQRGRMAAYATTDLRLKSGRRVAFVGPAHRQGRAILLLTATKK